MYLAILWSNTLWIITGTFTRLNWDFQMKWFKTNRLLAKDNFCWMKTNDLIYPTKITQRQILRWSKLIQQERNVPFSFFERYIFSNKDSFTQIPFISFVTDVIFIDVLFLEIFRGKYVTSIMINNTIFLQILTFWFLKAMFKWVIIKDSKDEGYFRVFNFRNDFYRINSKYTIKIRFIRRSR